MQLPLPVVWYVRERWTRGAYAAARLLQLRCAEGRAVARVLPSGALVVRGRVLCCPRLSPRRGRHATRPIAQRTERWAAKIDLLRPRARFAVAVDDLEAVFSDGVLLMPRPGRQVPRTPSTDQSSHWQ